MSKPYIAPRGLTGDLLVDAMTQRHYWVLDEDRTIDWSWSYGLLGEAGAEELGEWQFFVLGPYGWEATQAADVRFNFIRADSTAHVSPAAAAAAGSEINLAWTTQPRLLTTPLDTVWSNYQGEAADIFLDQETDYILYNWQHRAGVARALGLKHPMEEGGTVWPTLSALGYSALQPEWATCLAYGTDSTSPGWRPDGLQVFDLLALQAMYGKNMTTDAGDTFHDLWVSTTPPLFELVVETIWDAGGNDTVSAEVSSYGSWRIQLPNATLSSEVDTKVGYAALADDIPSEVSTLYWLMGDIENAIGSHFGDTLLGNDGANVLTGGGGNDYIDGGLGADVAVFRAARENCTVTVVGDEMIVETQLWGSFVEVDTLKGVERIQFDDANVAYDVDGAAGQAYRLYKAAFDRTPDLSGFGHQMRALDQGMSLLQVAQNFIDSPEFSGTYGALDTVAFVTQLYANVLGRTPDSQGLAFHSANLEAGMSRAQVLIGFSESPENQATLIGVIAQGMAYV